MTGRRWAILIAIAQFAFIARQPTLSLQTKRTPFTIPRIDILYPPYGTIFDRTCSQFLKGEEISSEWIAEAGRLRPTLQQEWQNEGPKYLSVVIEQIGLSFPYQEMQAVLTVCPVNTMSMPLMINIRSHLSAARDNPPEGDFAEKVFHELMHHYVEAVHDSSVMRKKYANEPAVVINHLHVMALEKLALLRLGKSDEMKYLDQLYRTDPSPSYYKRAWEIVNDIEGYEIFVNELKTAPNR